jgi:hypothetical protein
MIDALLGLLPIVAVIGGWLLLQTVILPRFGVRT